jgi:hypothetical protein
MAMSVILHTDKWQTMASAEVAGDSEYWRRTCGQSLATKTSSLDSTVRAAASP